jgi:hypothetical protein
MDIDGMLGADIEKGLVRLKSVAEGKQVATAAAAAAQANAGDTSAVETAKTAEATTAKGQRK